MFLDNRPRRTNSVVFATTVGSSAYTLLRGQLSWFREQGWGVSLVATPDDAAKATAERERVRLVGIPMDRRISVLRDVVALGRWIKLLCRDKPQAVNVGTPKAGLLGILAAWVARVPRRVYIVRGLRLEGASGVMAWILWAMERVTIGLATDVIIVSQSLADELTRRGLLPAEKGWIIGPGSSNGVNSVAIENRIAGVDPCALRRGLGIPDGSFVVGFIGRITPDKGISTLLEAMQRLDGTPAHLVLVGAVEDDSLVEAVEKLGDRATRVSWTDDIWGYLPALDVLCLPSEREGFPTVVLEAAAAGVPAVTTRATGAVDSVIDGETGFLVDVGDPAALAQKIGRLMHSPQLRQELGEKARIRAAAEFQPERVWSGVMGILNGDPQPPNSVRPLHSSQLREK